jgi:hypothetical protein
MKVAYQGEPGAYYSEQAVSTRSILHRDELTLIFFDKLANQIEAKYV